MFYYTETQDVLNLFSKTVSLVTKKWSLKTGGLWFNYSGPSILRPNMGPRKCGLILQVVLKQRSFNTENCPLGPNSSGLIIKGGLK